MRSPVTLAQTWGQLLSTSLGRAYTNCAVGGNTSADLLNRFATVLANPGSAIGIMIGANDAFVDPNYSGGFPVAYSGISYQKFSSNLSSLFTLARTAGKTPFYVTPWAFWSTPSLNNFPYYINAAKALCAQMNVPCVDAFQIQFDLAAGIGQNLMWDEYESDYQHPNARGHEMIYMACRHSALPI